MAFCILIRYLVSMCDYLFLSTSWQQRDTNVNSFIDTRIGYIIIAEKIGNIYGMCSIKLNMKSHTSCEWQMLCVIFPGVKDVCANFSTGTLRV
ncbi:MAG TPA: hypothetical protein VK452_06600 [Dissulfurispiraceae bacterium]|nr:hypothetical protein [Dissulfurispiraceae bacterium]